MAKLYFRYGAMGSSKTANAIMVQYNYQERGQKAIMLKPMLDNRDGARTVGSRSGLSAPCGYVEELPEMDLTGCDCVIVDEAQFLTKEQVRQLVDIVDDRGIPVICYGLRADFQGNLFEGSQWLMAWADTIEEIKTVCWCGRKATYNARVANGRVVRSGEQIVLGGNESYVALCRKHWATGQLAPVEIRRIRAEKQRYMEMLLDADPSEKNVMEYLEDGELYVLSVNGQTAAVAVVSLSGDTCELNNLDTVPELRSMGYGSRLLRHLIQLYGSRAKEMIVGTSPDNVEFYERFGFKPAFIRKNFFIDHYDEPIIENGQVLTDMICLSRPLG